MKTGRPRPKYWSAAVPFWPLVAALLGPAQFAWTIATGGLYLGGPASGSYHFPRYSEHGSAITFSSLSFPLQPPHLQNLTTPYLCTVQEGRSTAADPKIDGLESVFGVRPPNLQQKWVFGRGIEPPMTLVFTLKPLEKILTFVFFWGLPPLIGPLRPHVTGAIGRSENEDSGPQNSDSP